MDGSSSSHDRVDARAETEICKQTGSENLTPSNKNAVSRGSGQDGLRFMAKQGLSGGKSCCHRRGAALHHLSGEAVLMQATYKPLAVVS